MPCVQRLLVTVTEKINYLSGSRRRDAMKDNKRKMLVCKDTNQNESENEKEK